jgi:ribosomal protein L35
MPLPGLFFERFPMGKFKPHKGLLKRIRITKSGKIKGRVANGSHLRSGKPSKRLRHMQKPRYFANKGVLRRVTHLLGRRIESARETAAETRAAAAAEKE